MRILVVDDDCLVRTAVCALLNRAGHEADGVRGGAEALDAVAGRDFDVLFLDVQMPGMGGDEVAARIRGARLRRPPWIVGLSAEPRRDGRGGDMDAFLCKPVRRVELGAVLDRVASRPCPTPEGGRPG